MGIRTLVILAAGRGQRFGGPKQLAPVGPKGETLMAYSIDGAAQVGFEQVVIVTRPDLDAALRPLQRDQPVTVAIVHQASDQRGTVPAVLAARPYLGDDSFAVVNADDFYSEAALGALRSWAGPGHAVAAFRLAATILPGGRPVNRALCQTDGDGRLTGLKEVSVREADGGFVAQGLCACDDFPVPADQLVSMNAWAMAPAIWPYFEGGNDPAAEEVVLPVVIGALVSARTIAVTCLGVDGPCVGLTWPDEVAMVRSFLALNH